MLHRLSARDDRFKTVNFKSGLNVLVADTTDASSETDSRNGAGKSSVVELLHFLLGAKADGSSFLGRESLRDIEFDLVLDWPGTTDGVRVRRIPARANEVVLEPDVTRRFLSPGMPGRLSLAEWQQAVERDLFQLTGDHPGVTGRALLSLYMRRVRASAFNDAVRTHPQQSAAEATTNIAYLLGLDWRLASRYRDLASREATRRKLTQAAKDPVWGKIVGKSAELRGQITVAQQRVTQLERQVENFQVVPEYERLQQEADSIDKRIRQTRAEDIVDRRNLQDLEASLAEAEEPDTSYLSSVYEDLGVILPNSVVRRYDEVEEFHESVVRNRRTYLQSEVDSIKSRLEAREQERHELGNRQSQVLRTLNEGGALDALTALQQTLAQEQAALEALRNRFAAAQTLEASRAEIKADRSQIERELRTDLRERENILNEISLRFLDYASALYGDGREAYLEIDPAATHLRIHPYIESQDSHGIRNMVTFCFDLTVAVTAHREGRGPDFLIHDSHLFDGVDERQMARAFQLAAEISEQEGIQYVATLNSDDLAKCQRMGVGLDESIISPRLTDQYESGGLFGFRFA